MGSLPFAVPADGSMIVGQWYFAQNFSRTRLPPRSACSLP